MGIPISPLPQMFARLLDAVPVGQAACAFFIWQVIIGMRRNITAKPSYPSVEAAHAHPHVIVLTADQ